MKPPTFDPEGVVHSFVEIALINAAMVVPLALIAEGSGRLLRRPRLTHLLWVIVLVKLLTPPVLQIPLVNQHWLATVSMMSQWRAVPPAGEIHMGHLSASEAGSSRSPSEATPAARKSGGVKATGNSRRSRPRTLAQRDQRLAQQQASPLQQLSRLMRSSGFQQSVFAALLMLWALGSLVWFGMQVWRCQRFRWSLTKGEAAGDELQTYADQLARRLGLRKSPTVWLMPGVMSPMLWGSGSSVLLIFPEMLLDRLDCDATGTLVTHELAHFRRRDHHVRVLSLIVTGMFWWHPVIWWARRSIEAVEEECCDALVLTSGSAPKKYAEAILDTVDFLAEFRLKLPPLATGLGQVPFLRQRLTWIMRGPRRQDLGPAGQFQLLLFTAMLPWQPAWMKDPYQVPARPPIVVPAPTERTVPESPALPNSDLIVPGAFAHRDEMVPAESPAPSGRWAGFIVRSQSYDARFVVMGNKQSLFLLDLESGTEFELSDFAITAMAFSPNTHQFATVGSDHTLRLWNAATHEVCREWNMPGGNCKSVDVARDVRWIATGSRDGLIRLWEESRPDPVWELPRELSPVNCLRFSLDGKLLAVATGDWMAPQSGRIALFDVGRWTERISMNWNSPAAAVAFRADGESLVSGDWQGRIAKWSIATGELLGLTEGHKDLVASAEFSPTSSALGEIDVPDFQPDSAWGEPDSGHWLLNGWKLTVPPPPTRMNGTVTP